MKNKILILLFLGLMSGYAQKAKKATPSKKATTTKTAAKASTDGIYADILTNKGKITVKLEYEKTPVTVANFISLAEGNNPMAGEAFKGKPYYDGIKFHRVIKDFMIQGGDPTGTGNGDPGYKFKDEIVPELKHSKGGILSMANAGPGTNGSQFFITHKETPWLDGRHTVFGEVTSGMDAVNAIEQGDNIEKVTIIRKGSAAKKFNAAKVFETYYAGKKEDDLKQAALEEERKKKDEEDRINKEREFEAKYGQVMKMKKDEFAAYRKSATKTPSGLEYTITKKGSGIKPASGAQVQIGYAGYFENGKMFDTSFEEIAKLYGKHEPARAEQGGYNGFPFTYGNKSGLIPGFLEAIENMSLGDKATVFIPAALGYGTRGAGNVIPPNSNLIFEIEMTEPVK